MAETTLLVSGGLKTEAPIITDVDGDTLCVNQVVPSKRRDDSTSTSTNSRSRSSVSGKC